MATTQLRLVPVRARLSALLPALFMALFISSLLSACTSGGGDATPPEIRKGAIEDLNRCIHKPNEGSEALLNLAGDSGVVDSGFFGKLMNRPDVVAILDASAEATIRYAKAIGLNVFKTPYNAGERICPTFATLDFAPPRLQAIWSMATANIGTGTTGTLLGLYFDYVCLPNTKEVTAGSTRCSNTRVTQPVILVTEATDKWTLMHEMMHHNFKKTNKERGFSMPDHQLLSELNKTSDAIEKMKEKYSTSESRENFEMLLTTIHNAVKLNLETITRGKLEETAIEGLLIELWTSDQLRQVTTTGSSVWYMGVGADAALEQIPDMKPLVKVLSSEIEKHGWPEYGTRISEIELLPTIFADNIKQSINTARMKLRQRGISLPPARSAEFLQLSSHEQRSADDAATEAALDAHMANHENPKLETARNRLFRILTAPAH